MSNRLLFHIGFHKTATSWMQKHLFISEHGFRQVAGHREVWQHLVGKHGLLFDASEMRSCIRCGMGSLQDGEVPVVSSEILSGHPFFGGIGSDIFALRLKEIAPDARILISVRSQHKLITSVYLQYLQRGGTLSAERFLSGDPGLGFYGFRPEHFEFHRLVAFYQELFGPEDVHLISQEGLVQNMDLVARGLADFAKNKLFTNIALPHRRVYARSYPEYAVPLLRWTNKVQRSVLVEDSGVGSKSSPGTIYKLVGATARRIPFSAILEGYRPVSKLVEQRFKDRFSSSNRKLISIINQNLFWPSCTSDQLEIVTANDLRSFGAAK